VPSRLVEMTGRRFNRLAVITSPRLEIQRPRRARAYVISASLRLILASQSPRQLLLVSYGPGFFEIMKSTLSRKVHNI
jgi:hypothetical protein